MSFWNKSFIDFTSSTSSSSSIRSNLRPSDIFSLFEKTASLQANQVQPNQVHLKKNACLLFLEPSTRTQMSFDLACRDVGISPVIFTPENSSLKKGETLLDTLLTLQALQFDLFIIRHGEPQVSLKSLAEKIQVPIINAGEGVSGHPTQALLDLYTIFEVQKKLDQVKVLFVGDIKHSRVVSSNIELFNLMGIEYAFCGPQEFMPLPNKNDNPNDKSKIKYFESLEDGMNWATVTMALRNQLERHQNVDFEKFINNFIQKYCITKERLNSCKKEMMILHPGPFNRDIEISSDILDNKRVFIFKQVENGRKIRRALIHMMMASST